jgi:hypothetical protein
MKDTGGKFATGINNTVGKFATSTTGVVDTDLPSLSMIFPAENLVFEPIVKKGSL